MENRKFRPVKMVGQQIYPQKEDMSWKHRIFVHPFQSACGKAREMCFALHGNSFVEILKLCLSTSYKETYTTPTRVSCFDTARLFEQFLCLLRQTDKILLHFKNVNTTVQITRITV